MDLVNAEIIWRLRCFEKRVHYGLGHLLSFSEIELQSPIEMATAALGMPYYLFLENLGQLRVQRPYDNVALLGQCLLR
jgi:hypothetical protein